MFCLTDFNILYFCKLGFQVSKLIGWLVGCRLNFIFFLNNDGIGECVFLSQREVMDRIH